MAQAKAEENETGLTKDFKKLGRNLRESARERNSEAARINRRGLGVLYRKELADHLESTRFQILFVLFAVVTAFALNGAISSLASTAQQTSDGKTAVSEFLFLRIFTTSGNNVFSFSTFVGFLGPIIGIMLGFDAVNEELAQGTLNRLAAQPIYRDTILIAKFLAGATVIALTVFSLGGWMVGIALIRTGLVLSGEQVARIVVWFLMATLYMCLWLAMAEFFSVVCRHAATSALWCIALWLVLLLFMSIIASAIAGWIFPTTGYYAQINTFRNYALQLGINRISPYYIFSEITTILLNPNVSTTNIVSLLQSSEGAIASYLTFGQSMLQIWPHIVCLLAETAAFFAAAYICFMNREIRA